jgi:hypothetical protein
MKKIIGMLSLIAAVAASSAAHAQSGIRLGQPAYGGNGCPAGSASATLSPNEDTLSLLFDSYMAEAGGVTGRRVDRKACNIAIPVTVPQGYSISVFKVDYRGFNSLPSGAFSRFAVEYFFAGSVGPRQQKTFVGPSNSDYLLTSNLQATSLVWTPCGASTNLRVNSSMMTQTNNAMQQALSTVDSVDVNAGLVYHIQWRRCI